jgi:hypothetical protein
VSTNDELSDLDEVARLVQLYIDGATATSTSSRRRSTRTHG